MKPSVNYLGYKISGNGIEPAEDRLKAVRELPRPTNVKELKRFIGICGYYRPHIHEFGNLVMPLQVKLRKNAGPYEWTPEMENAFVELIKRLLSSPVRVRPDMSKLFVVTCDASDIGIGATLEQEGKLVEAVSHGFNDTERRWPVLEKEAYALIFSLRKWRNLLLGRKFVIRTDCKPLLWLRGSKDHLGKLGKWAMTLFEFDPGLTLEHISGKENRVADGLSTSRVKIASAGILKEKWAVETNKDDQIQKFLKEENTILSDGVAVQNTKHGQRLMVPKAIVPEVLTAYHSDPMGGHLGEAKVYMVGNET